MRPIACLGLLQTIGSVVVFAIISLSGAAALALALVPDSPHLWYVDREIFGVLRFARSSLFPAGPVMMFVGLFGVALAVSVRGWMFGAGLLSHVCFVLVFQPAYTWLLASPQVRTAALVPVDVSAQGCVVTWLSIGATVLSLAACHLTYVIGLSRRLGAR